LKTIVGAIVVAIALFCFTSCAGTTTAVGLTTNQDAEAADHHR